ncbi:MAG: hypothetical protein E7393_04850 [Ruminococcaceae bacterium]|nr:hypothetical protein [Oscillospiraceae bacterium]
MLYTIVEFFKACSALQVVSADFLPDSADVVSIQAVGCDPIVHQYTGGDSIRQFTFKIVYRDIGSILGQGYAEELFQAVCDYMQTSLPKLAYGKTPQRFEVLKTVSVAERDYSSTQYEMACRLLYYQKGE